MLLEVEEVFYYVLKNTHHVSSSLELYGDYGESDVLLLCIEY